MIKLKKILFSFFFYTFQNSTSLWKKCGLIFVVISAYLLFGTMMANLILGFDVGDALWWAWSRLIDPGFIAEDKTPLARRILGSLFVVLGLVVIAGTIISFIGDVARRSFERILHGRVPKSLKGHTLICGQGARLSQLVEVLKNRHDPSKKSKILMIVPDLERLREIKALCPPDVFVMMGQTNNLEFLHKITAYHARRLILLDSCGLDIGSMLLVVSHLVDQRLAMKVAELGSSHVLDIYLETNSVELALLLSQMTEKMALNEANIHLHVVNSVHTNARMILREHPLDCERLPINGPSRVACIIYGWSSFAQAFLEQIVAVGHFSTGPTRIIIVDSKVSAIEVELKSRIPVLANTTGYLSQLLSVDYAKNIEDLMAFSLPKTDLVTAVICGEDSNYVMIQALALRENVLPGLKQVFLELDESSGYRDILNKISTDNFKMIAVGGRAKVFDLAEWLDSVAEKLHQRYLAQREAQGRRKKDVLGRYENKSDYDWAFLDEVRRNWNRSSADHAEIKVRALADYYKTARPFWCSETEQLVIGGDLKCKINEFINQVFDKAGGDLEVVELLSKMEHDRWSAEKVSQGWVYAKEKSVEHKTSPYLVDYVALDEEIKEYDRQAVAELLKQFV
jgi:hypothetical protein